MACTIVHMYIQKLIVKPFLEHLTGRQYLVDIWMADRKHRPNITVQILPLFHQKDETHNMGTVYSQFTFAPLPWSVLPTMYNSMYKGRILTCGFFTLLYYRTPPLHRHCCRFLPSLPPSSTLHLPLAAVVSATTNVATNVLATAATALSGPYAATSVFAAVPLPLIPLLSQLPFPPP